jgi:hypothetical protein
VKSFVIKVKEPHYVPFGSRLLYWKKKKKNANVMSYKIVIPYSSSYSKKASEAKYVSSYWQMSKFSKIITEH